MYKPICGNHADYQARIDAYVAEHPTHIPHLPNKVSDFIERAYNHDLTPLAGTLADLYLGRGRLGRPPRDPLCMLRSYLLSLKCGVQSIDDWVEALHLAPVLAVVSGFDPDDVPGVGTFYDFFRRVCPEENRLPRIHAPKKVKVEKPAHKGDKAESIEPETCADLYAYYEENDPDDMVLPELLIGLYKTGFLQHSVDLGVIPKDVALSMAGDGSPIYTGARERSKPTCDCRTKGITTCDCDREYSQPDCDYGYDSDHHCFFFGFHVYALTVAGLDHDLPLFAQLHQASRHDAKSLIHTQANMDRYLDLEGMGINIGSILLDSAHDAIVIYEHYHERGITPFIDLNKRNGNGRREAKGDITFDANGWPLCPQKLKMRRDGFEKARNRWKYRCPRMEMKDSKRQCTCASPCSESAYGRVVHISVSSDSLRFPANPARGTAEWKNIYKGRTAAERFNKRLKIDYRMESARHRSSRMWYWRLFGIMMCLHLDAWDVVAGSSPFPDEART